MKIRKEIPEKIKEEVLFLNGMTCCMCHDRSKPGLFYHIDENLKNNKIGNLAIMCADCQEKISNQGKFHRKISPQTIKKMKLEWETKIRLKKVEKFPPLASPHKIEQTLFGFEIRKTAYSISSLPDTDTEGIKLELEYLLSILRHEGYREEILDSICAISPLIYQYPAKCSLILRSLELFLSHYYSEKNNITNKDNEYLDNVLEIVQNITAYSIMGKRDIEVIKSGLSAYDNLFFIFFTNNLELGAMKIVDALLELKERCINEKMEQGDFPKGAEMIDEYLEKFNQKLLTREFKWKLVQKLLSLETKEPDSPK